MRWKPKQKNWSKITWVAKKWVTNLKKTGLQIKIMKEAKDLDIGIEKKERVAKKNFLPSKNFVSVEKY